MSIMNWNDEGIKDNVIWWTRVDGRYLCEVIRVGDGAKLSIYDHDNNDKLCAEKSELSLAYGAIFGPDVDDVGYWSDLIIQWIDYGNFDLEI